MEPTSFPVTSWGFHLPIFWKSNQQSSSSCWTIKVPQVTFFFLPLPFVISIICFVYVLVLFLIQPVKPHYLGRNAQEGEERWANMPHLIKYWSSFLVIRLEKSQSTLKQFIENTFLLTWGKVMEVIAPGFSTLNLINGSCSLVLSCIIWIDMESTGTFLLQQASSGWPYLSERQCPCSGVPTDPFLRRQVPAFSGPAFI